jgi:ketosteroid isomerase-like protein
MNRTAALVLSTVVCVTSGCAHQGASRHVQLFNRAGKSDSEVVKPEYIRHVDMRVTRYGETAVVTGIENLKGTYKGRPGEMALRFSNTLVRRDGRWQLVSHQSTRVQSR